MTESFDLWHWIVNNTVTFLFTTFVLGTIVEIMRRVLSFVLTLKFRGWKVTVQPKDKSRSEYAQNLLWQEIEKFQHSAFEKRKFIQSVCSSEGARLSAGEIDTSNENGWVFEDKMNKQYLFDFSKFPSET